jgi:hypothetical protein
MEETYRRLEEELDRRMVEAKKFASFYKFENEGDEVAGKLLYTRKIRREEGEEDTVWVIETFGGEQYTLPSYAYLQAALADAEPGDYVKIRYAGEGKGGRGRSRPKLFDVAVLPKDEAEALLAEKPPIEEKALPEKVEVPKPKEEAKPEELKKPEEKPAAKPKPEEKPKEEKKPAEKREVKLPEKAQLEKAESMLRTFAEFYGEVPVRTVEERLRRAGVEVPLDELLAKVPVLKREGDVLKRA